MRRKNLLVIEVDVYSVGIYIDEDLDKSLLSKSAENKQTEISLDGNIDRVFFNFNDNIQLKYDCELSQMR